MYNSELTNVKLAAITKILCLGIVLTSGIAICAQAQQIPVKQRPVPPDGPLLNSAPDHSQWVTTYIYPQDQPKGDDAAQLPALPPTSPRKILTTKTGNIIHEETVDVAGNKTDKWQEGSTLYLKPKNQAHWGVSSSAFRHNNPKDDPFENPLPANGFHDLDWITKDTFTGSIQSAQSTLLIFVPMGADKVDLSDPKKSQDHLDSLQEVAYIDAQTRLPVSLRIGKVVRTYTFLPPPSSMLALPPDLQREIKQGEERTARLLRSPAKDY